MNRIIAILFTIGLILPSLAMGADGDEPSAAFARVKFDDQGIPHGTLFTQTLGGTERQITTSAVNAGGPVWSPDGEKIAFNDFNVDADGSVFDDAYIADLATGSVSLAIPRVTVSDMTDDLLTFTFVKGGTDWIGVARHDGSERVDLAPDSHGSSLSSDGSRALFIRFDTINIIDRDGTGQRTILQDRALDTGGRPRFAGNDAYVVYNAYRGAPGQEELFVCARHIETGDETILGQGGLWGVVGDWIVIGSPQSVQYAVSLDGETRFELPFRGLAFHGDLGTLAPAVGGDGDDEPRAVEAAGKLPTTWATLKTR